MVIYERTVSEARQTFLVALKDYITDKTLYDTLLSLTSYLMREFEPIFDENIYLSNNNIYALMERIERRARPGERVTYQYLERL